MKALRLGVIAVAACFAFAAGAQEVKPIGAVKTVAGAAFVVSGQQRLAAVPGLGLKQGDQLETGADGSLGVTFRDDTLIAIGPDTQVSVDRYAFEPKDNQLGFLARVRKGTLTYVSGNIAKLAPEQVAVETPSGTIGVRGTRFAVKVTGDGG